jgi:hypothetical protein
MEPVGAPPRLETPDGRLVRMPRSLPRPLRRPTHTTQLTAYTDLRTLPLQVNQQLNVNQQLVAPNGKTHLVMQPDGNLVLYRNDTGAALWASRTWHKPVNRAVMQGDGNFVCYDSKGHAYWASGTAGHPDFHIVLLDDGNLVIYDTNMTELWTTNTVENWDPFTVDTGDVHLDTGEWMHASASMCHTGLTTGRSRVWCTIDLRDSTEA